jgi:polysaccharide pyruvyl transferase WcaK-like protein
MGDVGAGEVLHVGDEAMLETAMVELGDRQHVRWTVVTSHPRDTAARYGAATTGRFGFAGLSSDAEREARLAAVVGAARGEVRLPPGDPAQALLDAVSVADAVLVAGGGNLVSTWPQHVYERAALAQVAAARQTPLVVLGQGIGPQLTGRDGELVSATLTGARLVGVRERHSAWLARRLGVPAERLWCTVDDAWTLPGDPVPGVEPGSFVAVTLSDFTGLEAPEELVEPLALLLDGLVATTGLDVLLVPHEGAVVGAATRDVAFHDLLAAATKSGQVAASPLRSARETAWLAQHAALVVSSRYHPVVFGLSAATPVVAVAVDDYTEQKLRGALDLVGLDGWCVSVLGLRAGFLEAAVDEAWQRRAEITAHLAHAVARQTVLKAGYWDAVSAAVSGAPLPVPAADDLDLLADAGPEGDWTLRNQDALSWSRLFAARQGDAGRALDVARVQGLSTARELAREQLARRAALDEARAVRQALTVERAAGEAARVQGAEVLEQHRELRRQHEELAEVAARQAAEHERLQQTKLLRWSRPARRLYSTWKRRM